MVEINTHKALPTMSLGSKSARACVCVCVERGEGGYRLDEGKFNEGRKVAMATETTSSELNK